MESIENLRHKLTEIEDEYKKFEENQKHLTEKVREILQILYFSFCWSDSFEKRRKEEKSRS
jgi:hypothetical protein